MRTCSSSSSMLRTSVPPAPPRCTPLEARLASALPTVPLTPASAWTAADDRRCAAPAVDDRRRAAPVG
eukprot:scaffold76602_cov63-Phaeocystis_antarctica.AAC.5